MIVLTGQNRQEVYQPEAPGSATYRAQPGVYHALVRNADGTWTLTDPRGTRQEFDVDGKLICKASTAEKKLSKSTQ